MHWARCDSAWSKWHPGREICSATPPGFPFRWMRRPARRRRPSRRLLLEGGSVRLPQTFSSAESRDSHEGEGRARRGGCREGDDRHRSNRSERGGMMQSTQPPRLVCGVKFSRRGWGISGLGTWACTAVLVYIIEAMRRRAPTRSPILKTPPPPPQSTVSRFVTALPGMCLMLDGVGRVQQQNEVCATPHLEPDQHHGRESPDYRGAVMDERGKRTTTLPNEVPLAPCCGNLLFIIISKS